MRQTPQNMKEFLSRVKDRLHLKSLVIALSAIVVFTTTYLLILPAFTLDKNEAADQGGIDVVAVETAAETADAEDQAADEKAGETEAAVTDEKAGETEAAVTEEKSETKADSKTDTAAKTETKADTTKSEEKSEVKLMTKKTTITAEQAKGDDFAVSAVIDKNAKVPEDTVITATELDKKTEDFDYDQYKKDALAALQKDSSDVAGIKSIKFYDISLESESQDNSVEPAAPVNVKIAYEDGMKVDNADNVRIVHFAEQKDGEVKAEVLDTDENKVEATVDKKESKLTEASFETDGFSTFAVVEVEVLTTQVITADGETYTIKVAYRDDANIPDDAVLEAREIEKDSEEYKEYLDQTIEELGITEESDAVSDELASAMDLIKAIGSNEETESLSGEVVTSLADSVSDARYFDISIMSQGEEIEPDAPVEVTISYDEPIKLTENESVQAVHFAKEGTEITNLGIEESSVNEVTFVQDSFSVTGTVVTTASASRSYYVILERNGSYYAVASNGAVTQVSYSVEGTTATIAPYSSSVEDDDISVISADNSGRIRIDNTNYYSYAYNNASILYRTSGGGPGQRTYFLYYNGSNLTESENDYTTVHLVRAPSSAPTANITVHYVDSDGNPIEGVENKDISMTTDISESSVHFDTYTEGGDIFDLVENIEGYEYYSTHLTSVSGTKINAEVLYQNGTWRYEQYGSHSTSTLASGSDVYVVYKKDTGSSSGGGSGGGGSDELDKPHTSKDLDDNGDGTSTLSLSISGSTKDTSKTTGANVIIVFDRSDSMNTTRLTAAKTAARAVATQLLGVNTSQSSDPLVEMCVVPFGATATTSDWYSTSGNNTTYETNGMNGYINNITNERGTNWERALQVAKQAAADQLAVDAARPTRAAGGSDYGRVDDTYIIFITDGNPTRYMNNGSVSSSSEGDVDNYYTNQGYAHSIDEARDIVQSGYELYSIGIYGNVEVLHYLTDYAYTGRSSYDPSTSQNTWNHFFLAGDESSLLNTLGSIASKIEGKLSIAGVSITDGVATSVTSTNVTGNTSNFEYKVTNSNGTTKYTVSIAEDGTATFTIGSETFTVSTSDSDTSHTGSGGTAYTAKYENKTTSFEYKTPSGETATKTSTNEVYTVTIGTGENAQTYTMSPAAVDNSGEVKWDLAGVGTIGDGETWTVSFVVWPDQEAYDIVADLNNGVGDHTWNETGAQEAVYAADGTTFLYWKNGITGYEHIVKYDTNPVTYGALTNTSQSAEYYVYDSNTKTYTGPLTVNMETPQPMSLEDANASIQKKWDVGLQPTQLISYLYDTYTAKSKERSVTLDVFKGTSSTPYVSETLGWDSAINNYKWVDEELISYDYYPEDEDGNLTTYTVGTTWQENLSIAVGLMISANKAEEYGLTNYPSVTLDGAKYYILDTGNDYNIKERAALSYQFDLITETYHPMLKDGELYNLTDVEYNEDGSIKSFASMEPMTSLVATNTLRGGINLNKVVKDSDGNTLNPSDEFTFTITLTNDKENTFVGEDIPWYAVNGNYYHDEDWNYITEDTAIAIYGSKEAADAQGGNILTASNNAKTASATLKIKTTDALRIANVPLGTTYTISESDLPSGYVFTKIDKVVGMDVTTDGETSFVPDEGSAQTITDSHEITAEIVPNRQNNITVTNTVVKSDMLLIKTDDKGAAITSADDTAIFNLTKNTKSDGTGAWENATTDNSTVASDGSVTVNTADGIKLEGLKDGLYQLQESKSPNGYIVNNGSVYFKISAGTIQFVKIETIDGVTTVTEIEPPSGYVITPKTSTTPVALRVANTPGEELPMTGGIGTTIFYILGSLLVIGCGVVLVSRRRMGSDK